MKAKVAAQLLSHTAAAAIETYSSITSLLPSDAVFTAEFIELIDCLFDSLNDSSTNSTDGKQYRCPVTESTPHVELWSRLLTKISNWKHGITNNNPTCNQFTTALKTVVIKNLAKSKSISGNCEDDDCTALTNLTKLLNINVTPENSNDNIDVPDFTDTNENVPMEETQALAYVAGYILKKIDISKCSTCQEDLLAKDVSPTHVFTSFKEYRDDPCLQYANDNMMRLLYNVHKNVNSFVDKYRNIEKLEDTFKHYFNDS
ncbi:hypothetical protein ILUMI_04715, partial [Ignelater luminosus]